jgi:hypothetical protein
MKKIKWLKRLVILAVVVGLMLSFTTVQAAGPPTAKDQCVGSWLGDPNDGLCYFYDEYTCSLVVNATGSYFVWRYWIYNGSLFVQLIYSCGPEPSLGPGPNVGVIKTGEGGTLSARDWHVDYSTGACESPCRLTANGMTNAASKAGLPGMVGSAYFKTDSTEPYMICYDGGDANMLYQFVSGEWVPAPTTWYGDSICTTAVGPGAFAAAME